MHIVDKENQENSHAKNMALWLIKGVTEIWCASVIHMYNDTSNF